jgi:hypothetical protein
VKVGHIYLAPHAAKTSSEVTCVYSAFNTLRERWGNKKMKNF